MRYLLAAALLLSAMSLLSACSDDSSEGAGGSSHTPELCSTDEDCGRGEVCFHELAGSYCTDTCGEDSDCRPKFDCELQEEEQDSDCKDVGSLPDGRGYCERFDHLAACLDQGAGGG